ncbi:MAG: hypothetical protein ACD_75C01714G0001 [uncultured bacterium]|nr:MAG: hypothetical protein ACD_75C01714G0001 [uncultured bacterium]
MAIMEDSECGQRITLVIIEKKPVSIHDLRQLAVNIVFHEEVFPFIKYFKPSEDHYQLIAFKKIDCFAYVARINQVIVPVQVQGQVS